jgi:hypothetical protein
MGLNSATKNLHPFHCVYLGSDSKPAMSVVLTLGRMTKELRSPAERTSTDVDKLRLGQLVRFSQPS